ncbi:RDD family protein [Planotetraspora sp. GP83]|uniref:RDD family protein n=1 Tax=Planotetraspora sp. GP83 TaxID=3156264 RepID=UPI003513EE6C
MGAPPPPPGGPYEGPYEEPRVPWTPPPFGPAAPPLAGRWRRLFAGVTDGIIVAALSAPFTWTEWKVVSDTATGTASRVNVTHTFLAGLIGFLYFWLLQSFWNGQTLGKKAFGMRVVRETGEPAAKGQIAVRQVVEILLAWLCCLGIIDLAWILFDRRKQALHDKAAKTLVVDA